MNWYRSVWVDEEMRQVDPEGYGMGLALGYVVIPALLLALVGWIIFQLLVSNKEK